MDNTNEAATGFPTTEEQIRAELEQIKPHLEEMTVFRSNWSGRVVLAQNALFKGMKPSRANTILQRGRKVEL